MALEQRCAKGHYFDPALHTSCPYCGVAGLEVGKTASNRPGTEPTQPKDRPSEFDTQQVITQSYFGSRQGIDPTVGWLVCIDGPDRGRDYKIHSEKNSIGRAATMNICISGDDTIAREYHAFVSYDPESNSYAVLPGTARGLVHLNRGEVLVPATLRPYDEIKLGKTTLLFIPLCGDYGGKTFRWL